MLIGLTGGIATGKSTFAGFMRNILDLQFFDADATVHHLLDHSVPVKSTIRSTFGPSAFNSDGTVNKSFLRKLIYEDAKARKNLEGLLHPLVRESWMQVSQTTKWAEGTFLADIPLLFETGASKYFDTVVVVASSETWQLERMKCRGINPDLQSKMLSCQMPLEEKVCLADHVVWNDGSLENLKTEAIALCRLLDKDV